ncbi:DDE transposase family protein [Leptolyngbya sp. FACHB-36]|uniref:DDE transposase family protein n=1 Tax=Leptolyngbya sp. FACHB-36 TaxID=2692808 RepID=UPI0016814AD3|nr:DDE transposase family protein [Leptolyngbya sp. FACHB-36]MBD2021099.1 DDE transposase family protein [Leptolyngbya sp. FACHB-36]
MTADASWYVVRQENGQCAILPESEVMLSQASTNAGDREQWGPFTSQSEAIARRVGLIRAGKCRPA